MTGAADGTVYLHNVTLWRYDNLVAGRRPRVPRQSLDREGQRGDHPPLEVLKAVFMKVGADRAEA